MKASIKLMPMVFFGLGLIQNGVVIAANSDLKLKNTSVIVAPITNKKELQSVEKTLEKVIKDNKKSANIVLNEGNAGKFNFDMQCQYHGLYQNAINATMLVYTS